MSGPGDPEWERRRAVLRGEKAGEEKPADEEVGGAPLPEGHATGPATSESLSPLAGSAPTPDSDDDSESD